MVSKILCPKCDHKPFKNETNLAWHLEHIHGAEMADPESQVEDLDRLTERPTQSPGKQQPSELERRLQKLERVTGVRESDFVEGLIDGMPLTEQLSKQDEQIIKLSDTVSKLGEDLEIAMATSNELANRFDADEGVITRLRDRVELERQSLLKIIDAVGADDRRFGKLHVCPDCGASLHLHRNEAGSWHLECVICGYYSVNYKATVWKEKAGNHPIPVKQEDKVPVHQE